MSKRGREMAARCADWVQAHSGITKAYGTRDELIESFSVHGEFLAAVEKEKRRVIRANATLLTASEKALAALQRANAVDDKALATAESYAGVPAQTDIERRARDMIRREQVVQNTPKIIAAIDAALAS